MRVWGVLGLGGRATQTICHGEVKKSMRFLFIPEKKLVPNLGPTQLTFITQQPEIIKQNGTASRVSNDEESKSAKG